MNDAPETQAGGRSGRSVLLVGGALLVLLGLGIFALNATRDHRRASVGPPHHSQREAGGEKGSGHSGKSSREARARSERDAVSAAQRAQALLRVKRGEVGMIAISASQFESHFRQMMPPGSWSEMAGVPATLLSRGTVEEVLKSALSDGESMKATFSPGSGSEYAGSNLGVTINTMEVYEGYSEFQTKVVSGDMTVSTTITLPEGAVMMFRSRDNPPAGMLLVTANREEGASEPLVPVKDEGR